MDLNFEKKPLSFAVVKKYCPLQHIRSYSNISGHTPTYQVILQHIRAYSNISGHTPTYLVILQHIRAYSNISGHTPTYQGILQQDIKGCCYHVDMTGYCQTIQNTSDEWKCHGGINYIVLADTKIPLHFFQAKYSS